MSDFRINPFQGTEQSVNIKESGKISPQETSGKEQSGKNSQAASLKSDENDNVACEINDKDFSDFNFNSFEDADNKNGIGSGENIINQEKNNNSDSMSGGDLTQNHKRNS